MNSVVPIYIGLVALRPDYAGINRLFQNEKADLMIITRMWVVSQMHGLLTHRSGLAKDETCREMKACFICWFTA